MILARFLAETKGVKLELINDGKFNLEYNNLCSEAIKKTKAAKQIEAKNPDDSLNPFREALSLWRDLETLVDGNTQRIIFAKRTYRTENFLLKPITWILGVIGSAFIGMVMGHLFQSQIDSIVDWVAGLFQ